MQKGQNGHICKHISIILYLACSTELLRFDWGCEAAPSKETPCPSAGQLAARMTSPSVPWAQVNGSNNLHIEMLQIWGCYWTCFPPFHITLQCSVFFPQLLSKSNRCPARTLRMHHTSVWLKAMPTMAHPSTIHPTHPFQASPGLSAHQEDSTVSFKTAIQT